MRRKKEVIVLVFVNESIKLLAGKRKVEFKDTLEKLK